MNVNIFSTKAYENKSNWTLGQNKPNSNPIAERMKLMQSVYLQRIMKKNAAMDYEKQSQNKPNSNPNKANFLNAKMNLKLLSKKSGHTRSAEITKIGCIHIPKKYNAIIGRFWVVKQTLL